MVGFLLKLILIKQETNDNNLVKVNQLKRKQK